MQAPAHTIAPKFGHHADIFLYIGNSIFYYNNGMPSYVGRLAEGAPATDRRPLHKQKHAETTISGFGFD